MKKDYSWRNYLDSDERVEMAALDKQIAKLRKQLADNTLGGKQTTRLEDELYAAIGRRAKIQNRVTVRGRRKHRMKMAA